jgi:hypothetical protein
MKIRCLICTSVITFPVVIGFADRFSCIRNRNKLPFDYYKEIISSYRRLIDELDFMMVEEYAEKLPRTKAVMETIQMEVL